MNNDQITCCIGENDTWRLAKDSAHRMVLAMAITRATVIASGVDSSCPKWHASFRFSVPRENFAEFKLLMGCKVEPISEAGGAAITAQEENE